VKPGIDKEKVVNIEERIPKIKEQRKQKANRRLITFILLFFTMMLIIIYLPDADQQSFDGRDQRKQKRFKRPDHFPVFDP
jgi:hypothetical protein